MTASEFEEARRESYDAGRADMKVDVLEVLRLQHKMLLQATNVKITPDHAVEICIMAIEEL